MIASPRKSKSPSKAAAKAIPKRSLPNIYGLEFPSVIKFERWLPGKVYSQKLVLKNLAAKTERISYDLPADQHFIPDYPRVITLCSGMSTSILVKFHPAEMTNYRASIPFTCLSGSFVVQLEAQLPRHSLHAPSDINFGACSVHTPNHRRFTLTNDGDCDTQFFWNADEPFSVEPSEGKLAVGESLSITVTFQATLAKNMKGLIVCQFGENRDSYIGVALKARSHFPSLKASSCFLDFGECFARAHKTLAVDLVNSGAVTAAFDISKIPGPLPHVFQVSKSRESVGAMSTLRVHFRFSPLVRDIYSIDRFMVTCVGGHQFEIVCHGTSIGPTMEVRPKLINFGHVVRGTPVTRHLTFKNDSDTESIVQIRSLPNSKFDFAGRLLSLAPNESISMPIHFCSSISGHFRQDLEILTQESPPKVINMLATTAEDYNEIPPGRHERLLQEFDKAAKPPVIRMSCEIVEITPNSCRTMYVFNISPTPVSIAIKKLPDTASVTASLRETMIKPGKRAEVRIECLEIESDCSLSVFGIEAHTLAYKLDKPEFVQVFTHNLEVFASTGIKGESNVTIPESFRRLPLQYTCPGASSMMTFPITNNGSRTVSVAWQNESCFTLWPLRLLIDPSSSKICFITAIPQTVGEISAEISAVIDGNSKQMLKTSVNCVEPELTHELANNCIQFTPICVGDKRTLQFTCFNKSSDSMRLQWDLDNARFSITPPIVDVDRFTSVQFSITCAPVEASELVCNLVCTYLSSKFGENSLRIRAKATSVFPDIVCSPTDVGMGYFLLHSTIFCPISLRNPTVAEAVYQIVVLGRDDTILLTNDRFVIPPCTTAQFSLKVKASSLGPNVFRILAKCIYDIDAPFKELCLVKGDSVRSSLAIEDIWSAGRSKFGLWRDFSIDLFNTTIVEHAENATPVKIPMLMGIHAIGSDSKSTTKIRIKNNGKVPAEWMIYPAIDSLESEENFKYFSFEPDLGRLEIGQSCDITFSYSVKTPGTRRTTAVFELKRGNGEHPSNCFLDLHAVAIPTTIESVPPFRFPIIAAPFYGNSQAPSSQRISVKWPYPLTNGPYIPILQEDSRLLLLKTKGIVPASLNDIEFDISCKPKLQLPSSWSEKVKLLSTRDGSALEAELYLRHMEVGMLRPVQEYSLIPQPSAPLRVSKNCVDFGIVPMNSTQRSLIQVDNLSKFQNYIVMWNHPPEISIEPKTARIATGRHARFHLTFTTSSIPMMYSTDITCFAEEMKSLGFRSKLSLRSVSTLRRTSIKAAVVSTDAKGVTMSIVAHTVSACDFIKLGHDERMQTLVPQPPSKSKSTNMNLVQEVVETIIEDTFKDISVDNLTDDAIFLYPQISTLRSPDRQLKALSFSDRMLLQETIEVILGELLCDIPLDD